MQSGHSSKLSVAGLATGFGLGALSLYLMVLLGGAMSHGGWMMGGGTMMGYGSGPWAIGAALVFIICGAIIGAIVAIAHNAVAK